MSSRQEHGVIVLQAIHAGGGHGAKRSHELAWLHQDRAPGRPVQYTEPVAAPRAPSCSIFGCRLPRLTTYQANTLNMVPLHSDQKRIDSHLRLGKYVQDGLKTCTMWDE